MPDCMIGYFCVQNYLIFEKNPTKKPETNISKCLWYKAQLFGVTLARVASLKVFFKFSKFFLVIDLNPFV